MTSFFVFKVIRDLNRCDLSICVSSSGVYMLMFYLAIVTVTFSWHDSTYQIQSLSEMNIFSCFHYICTSLCMTPGWGYLRSGLGLKHSEMIATNHRVLAAEGCQHESWLLLRLDMLFSVTYPTHFYILGHNFSTVKATSGYWSLEVVSGVFPH